MTTQDLHLPLLNIERQEIHLWFVFPNDIEAPLLLDQYATFLTMEEKTQWQRFHFARHRHQYLVTRALIRTLLSRYLPGHPAEWRFSKNEYGKPEVIPFSGMMPLRFNLSHTEGLIACGVVLEHDIGVDVEDIERSGDQLGIADRFFSDREVNDLFALPLDSQKSRFFDYWTLKESYIKARGMGLSIPLGQFSFHLADNQPIRISFDPQLQDDPEHWQFRLLQPTPCYKAAVGLCQNPTTSHRLIIRQTVPLGGDQPLMVPTLGASARV